MFALFTLVACDPSTSSDADDTRLEAFGATDARSDYDGTETTGTTAVSGSERDWTLTVDPGDGTTVPIGIHSPGKSDLSILDTHALTIELGEAWGDDQRNVAITDEDGLVYVAQHTEGGPATDVFGDDLVAYGTDLGSGTLSDEFGDYDVEYYAAKFQTDDGPVEARAGTPIEAKLGGQTWRIVVHASFDVTKYPDEMPGCGGGIYSTLSYEMLRVGTTPDVARVSADPSLRLAGEYSCGG
jgi:hypothetical protein